MKHCLHISVFILLRSTWSPQNDCTYGLRGS